MQENASACYFVCLDSIGYGNGRLAYEPNVAVHSPMIAEVKRGLFLSGRIRLVVAVVGLYGYQAFVARLDAERSQVNGNREIASEVAFHFFAVDENVLFAHYRLKMHGDVLAYHVGRNGEVLAIPSHALIVAAAASF